MDHKTALYSAVIAMFLMPVVKAIAMYVGERNRSAAKVVWVIAFALALGWIAYLFTLK